MLIRNNCKKPSHPSHISFINFCLEKNIGGFMVQEKSCVCSNLRLNVDVYEAFCKQVKFFKHESRAYGVQFKTINPGMVLNELMVLFMSSDKLREVVRRRLNGEKSLTLG
jgi:hypothetical protein